MVFNVRTDLHNLTYFYVCQRFKNKYILLFTSTDDNVRMPYIFYT